MSSIIKSSFVSFSEQKKTIEVVSSNDAKIINPNNYSEPLDSAADFNEGQYDEEDYESYSFEHKSDEPSESETQGQSIEEIIAEAHLQAEQIIAEAYERAKSIEEEANAKGYDEGFKAGKKQALEEEQKLRKQLSEEIDKAREERGKISEKLQPLIAEIIQKMVTNMIGLQKFEPGVILYLIKLGLEEVDLYGDLIIKVSPDDFDEVMQNKEHLVENISDKISFEILKDAKLHKNDCIIDTSLGCVDCSLGERMKGLMRQLKLIEKSYASNENNS